jgi:hypothetical protein
LTIRARKSRFVLVAVLAFAIHESALFVVHGGWLICDVDAWHESRSGGPTPSCDHWSEAAYLVGLPMTSFADRSRQHALQPHGDAFIYAGFLSPVLFAGAIASAFGVTDALRRRRQLSRDSLWKLTFIRLLWITPLLIVCSATVLLWAREVQFDRRVWMTDESARPFMLSVVMKMTEGRSRGEVIKLLGPGDDLYGDGTFYFIRSLEWIEIEYGNDERVVSIQRHLDPGPWAPNPDY